MEISEEEQQTRDFDWYAVDEEGFLAHFTSAGFKRLPASVVADAEGLEVVDNYFQRALVKGGHKLAQHLAVRLHGEWKGEPNEARYLRAFVAMADRGLYSFDIESYIRPGLEYFLVALPEQPLLLSELPNHVQSIVSRTILKGVTLSQQSSVSYEFTLHI